MRRANVVHDKQVAGLPRLTYAVGLVRLVDHVDDVGADRVAVAEARVEGLGVRAVDVDEVLAYVGRQRPLVQECDLVEPAAPPGQGMPHDGVAALPRAQATAIPPLEVDRVGATVALHGAAVVRAEYVGDGRADIVVVVANQKPALPFEALDQVSRERAQDGRAVRERGGAAHRRRHETGKEHEAWDLIRVTQLVMHAHRLVGRPFRRGVDAGRIPGSGRKRFRLRHQRPELPKHRLGLGRISQLETPYPHRALLGDDRTDRVAIDALKSYSDHENSP